MAKQDKYQIDMTHGPLFGKVILFSVPLILSGVLQYLFHAADLIVIGQFAPPGAMASVGAVAFHIQVLLALFIGTSVGVNVLAANYIGAKEKTKCSQVVHTAVAFSAYAGIGSMLLMLFLTPYALRITNTPAEILEQSELYMRISCFGIPFTLLYNFGSAVMRADGDTRRPLYYLIISGIVNVTLNLIFVAGCGMEVAGVAIATVIAQILSAVFVLNYLFRARTAFRLRMARLRINWQVLKGILWIGLPAGFQSSMFSLSNLILQSSINTFGELAVAGNTAALYLESIVYVCSYAYYQSIISFIGQNMGAKKYARVFRSILYCTICSVAIVTPLGLLSWIYGEQLLAIFNTNPEVIGWGMIRLKVLMVTYVLCALMDIVEGGLRGLGRPIMPAVATLVFVCAMRVAWVFWVFPFKPTMEWLLFCYPVTWTLTTLTCGVYMYYICKRLFGLQFKQHTYAIFPFNPLRSIH